MTLADSTGAYAAELATVTRLIREAGELLLAEAGRPAPRGSSPSKLEVDAELEQLLGDGLVRAFPGDGILAEEHMTRAGSSGRRWVIDPQDGTSDFSAGARETSISIALEARGELVLGAVYVPCVPLVADPELRQLLGEEPLLVTWAAGGPLCRNGAPAAPPPAPDDLERGTVALVSRKVAGERLTRNREALAPARIVPCASIATRLALAAVGAVDVAYTLRNWLSPWDYAGGQALLQGAGGALLDAAGASVGPGHDGSAYVGARNPALARRVLERLARVFPDAIRVRPTARSAPPAPSPAARSGTARDGDGPPLAGDALEEARERVLAAGGRVEPDDSGQGRLVFKLPYGAFPLARDLARQLGAELREGYKRVVLLVPAAAAAATPPPAPARASATASAPAVAATAAAPPVPTSDGSRTPGGIAERGASLLDLIELDHVRRRVLAPERRRSQAEVARLLQAVEAEVARDPERCFAFAPDGHATLTTTRGTWSAGRFETPTIGELEARLAAHPRETAPTLTLSVLLGADPLTDVATLQATADGATLFQVASQFNCLEAPGAHLVPVADYVHDPTQGPRAAVSAFPGTFQRHYRAPDPDGARFVQGAGGALDLLATALGDAARTVHGYLRLQDVRDPAAVVAALESRLDQVRVGLQEDVQVVLGHDWGGPVLGVPRIAQAFTSTLALGGYSTRHTGHPHAEALCRGLLRAAYLGTLLGAAALRQRRAVLTLIGGGVFGNPHPLIWESILWAADRVAPLLPATLDVVVNSRELANHVPVRELLEATRARGGVVIEVGQAGVTLHRGPT